MKTIRVCIPPARFRAVDEPPDVAIVETMTTPPAPKSYTIVPTNETCSLHPNDPLWWVEITTGEEGLRCDRCGTSNLPARPHRPYAPPRPYSWRAFVNDVKRLFS